MSTETKTKNGLSEELAFYPTDAYFWDAPEDEADYELVTFYRMEVPFIVDEITYNPNRRRLNAFFNVKNDFTYEDEVDEDLAWDDSAASHVHNCRSCGKPYEMDEHKFIFSDLYRCKLCHNWG